MRGKFTQLALICLASLTILACEKLSGPTPNEVLNNYLDASLKGRYKEAYSYVSAEDKAIKDLQSYLKENEKKDNPFTQAVVSKVSFKILKLEQSDKKATADVEITLPNFGSIFTDVMGIVFKSAFGGGDGKEMEKILAKKFERGEVPLTTKKETFSLVKEKDGWKVFLDWKTEKIKKEKQAKIQTLLAEAKELKKSNKLHGALKKYEQVLELDSEMVEAKKDLEKIKDEIKSFKEKQAYIEKVALRNFRVSQGKKYGFGDPVPGIFGTIVNNGDRTLKEVEITVYFFDKNGTIVGEEDFHPVLVSEFSFGDDNKPLKPNYVKDFGYSVEDYAPSSWAGKVKGEITNIEFAE